MYVDTALREAADTPTPEVWAPHGDFLPKCTVWKEGKESLSYGET